MSEPSDAGSADGWRVIDQISLSIGAVVQHGDTDLEIGFVGTVEAKGESRRVVANINGGPGRPGETIARWRYGVPASVRVIARRRFDADHLRAIEAQLLDYASGRRSGAGPWHERRKVHIIDEGWSELWVITHPTRPHGPSCRSSWRSTRR